MHPCKICKKNNWTFDSSDFNFMVAICQWCGAKVQWSKTTLNEKRAWAEENNFNQMKNDKSWERN
jgi:hypothetical protein